MQADEAIANEHYAEHTEKPFFGELVDFITGGPLVAAVLEGHEAVAAARQLIGATNPIEAAPGSIRGDFGLEVTFNLVHGSDSDESAEREIGIWFPSCSGWPRVLRSIAARLGARRGGGRSARRSCGLELRGRVVPGVEELTERRPASRGRGRERPAQGAGRGRGAAEALVLGADTDVVARRRLLGKAGDEAEARRTSRRSRAATHEVLSGLVLVGRGRGGAQRRGRARGDASGELTPADVDRYLASGEWRDRAGALRDPGPRRDPGRARRGRPLERDRPAVGAAARARSRACAGRRSSKLHVAAIWPAMGLR